jgi:SAM-dependent methyltransferase
VSTWKLFDGDVAAVSTADFHADRERARHLEQPRHAARLHHAASLVDAAVGLATAKGLPGTVSDLGCGDGGLLQLLAGRHHDAWGYDFCPANTAGWDERGVKAEFLDVFGADQAKAKLGTVTVVTEVLEHLTDPAAALRWIASWSRFLVASSPWDETPEHHDECHAWAFDFDGYKQLIGQGGFRILRHYEVGRFQLVLGMRL